MNWKNILALAFVALITIAVPTFIFTACSRNPKDGSGSPNPTPTSSPIALPQAGRVFVEFNWSGRQLWWSGGPDNTWNSNPFTKRVPAEGSFWALSINGENVLVTAGHVLGVNIIPPVQIDGKKVTIESSSVRGVFGTLAYPPDEIGSIPNLADVAFVKPQDDRVFQTLEALKLSESGPQIGEKVIVIGFPSTSDPQQKEMEVTAVHTDSIVLNEPVDPGYSGGVLLSSSGKAYGVITSTDASNKQTIVIRLTPAILSGTIQWMQADKVLNRKF